MTREMNVVEKILARASDRDEVEPGEIVVADVDRAIFHDLSGYITGNVYEEAFEEPIQYPDRVTMVFDHTFSPPNEEQANILESNREFADRHDIGLFDCGNGNIHHVILQNNLVEPGSVVVGSDSHTPVHGVLGSFATGVGNNAHAGMVFPDGQCWFKVPRTVKIEITGSPPPGTTARDIALYLVGEIGEGGANYDALEFSGEYVDGLEFWDRWLLPLITIDVGAKCGYIEPDDETETFLEDRGVSTDRMVKNDPGAEYAEVWEFDVSDVPPQVACPPTVGNVVPIDEVAGTSVQWAELGGHGGGRLEDFELADGVLEERAEDVRFNLVPSSRETFSQALDAGLVDELHEAGGTWFPPSTGSNQAINMGAMTQNEAMISTHARNFPGRNGHPEAKMYLASALTVGASAANGEITDPREYVQ
ncbi:aconitase family protein [Halobellus salinisoli]|uniref:aconitase family protein n=1 Tax=Halobellus salinisoli TaxID=3108500 RepID=UPI003008BF79